MALLFFPMQTIKKILVSDVNNKFRFEIKKINKFLIEDI